jgi:peptide chain release factor 2
MASRLLTKSAAALLSSFHRRTPNPIHHLLSHGAALASLLRPTGGLAATADATLLCGPARLFSSSSTAAVPEVPMTVDSIASKEWTILPETESDWRSHAAAVAQSVKVIKRRLKVQFSNGISILMHPVNEIVQVLSVVPGCASWAFDSFRHMNEHIMRVV